VAHRLRSAAAALAPMVWAPAAILLAAEPAGASASTLARAAHAGQPRAAQPRASGPHWRVFKTIAVNDTALNAVVALPGGTAWAGGKSSAGQPLLYHFAGGRWRLVRVPGQVGTSVQDIAGTSANNVWATIANGDAVARVTTRGWSVTSFGPTPVSKVCGVVTTGRKSTWVFTSDPASRNGLAHHYNGSTWRTTKLPATATNGSTTEPASASSARNVWTWAYNASTRKYETMHFNGSRWQIVSLPPHLAPAGQQLLPQRMLAVSPRNVWATAYTTSLGVAGPVILLHWQGHGWARIAGPLPSGALAGPIAGDGRGGIWLGAVTQASAPEIFHYGNGTWTTDQVPANRSGVVSPTGMSLIPGTSSLWGTGVLSPTSLGHSNGAVIVKYG
jgi:hypothetical protein